MSVKGFLDKYFGGPQTQTQAQATAKVAPLDVIFEPRPPTIQPPLQIKPASATSLVPTSTQTQAQTTEGPKRQTFHIFTDGACSDNGRRGARGGFGVYVYSLEDRSFDVSEPLLNSEPQTNNRGELKAIQCALDIIDTLMPRISNDFDVYWIWTDSEYSINSLTKWADGWRRHGWKKRDGNIIQNLDLIKPIYEKLLRMPRVTLHHVRGHQDLRKHEFPYDGNAKADELATKSIRRSLPTA